MPNNGNDPITIASVEARNFRRLTIAHVEYVRADVVDEMVGDLVEARTQRDGLRNILGSVYRRLRDGRDVLPSQMEALRICYDRRRTLDALLPETEDELGRRETALVERAREAGL